LRPTVYIERKDLCLATIRRRTVEAIARERQPQSPGRLAPVEDRCLVGTEVTALGEG
jgi:hypothetical protein